MNTGKSRGLRAESEGRESGVLTAEITFTLPTNCLTVMTNDKKGKIIRKKILWKTRYYLK